MTCATLAVTTSATQAATATPTLSPFFVPNALFLFDCLTYLGLLNGQLRYLGRHQSLVVGN